MNYIRKIAQATGTSEQTIRLAMQQGCEWGMAVKHPDSRVYTYIPYPEKVKELFNVEVNDCIVPGGSDKQCTDI